MYRLLNLVLILIAGCQTGCSSLFNPDKSIATALASYFPDSGKPAGTESLDSILDDRGPDRSLPSGNPGAHGPATLEASNTSSTSSASSSWEKIERAVESDQAPSSMRLSSGPPAHDVPARSLNPSRKFVEGSTPPPDTHSGSVPNSPEHQDPIRIYDQPPRAENPARESPAGSTYQPIPPLIQPPTIFDRSIVEPPLAALDVSTTEASQPPRSDISWKDSLEATIAHLNEELKTLESRSPEADQLRKCLIILTSVDTDQSFVDLVHQLNTLIDSLPTDQLQVLKDVIESSGPDSAGLVEQLKAAAQRVAESGPLRIEQPAFCTAVQGYGKFQRFAENRFAAGDEVLLYCELENLASEIQRIEQAGGGETVAQVCRFNAQVAVINQHEETVFVKNFANVTDQSISNRQDFYLFFRFQIPQLPSGKHKLAVRIEDQIGNKAATLESPLPFEIIDRP